MFGKRGLWMICLMLGALGGLYGSSYGQGTGFPNQPIQIVVPFVPGGSNDVFYRALAEPFSRVLKVPVNVVNQGGGGGAVGAKFVANAKNDGYTVLGSDTSPTVFAVAVNSKIPYDVLRDFEPIAWIANQPKIVVALADSEFKSLDDLVSLAKKKPGTITYGTAGLGSDSYFCFEQFKHAAKVDITHMPFKGGGELLPNFLGGHVNLYCGSPVAHKTYIKQGKVRGLGLTGYRVPDIPDVPTFAEKGYPQVDVMMTFFLMGPKGVPAEVINVWNKALKTVLEMPDVIATLKRLDYKIDLKTDPNAMRSYLKTEIDKCTQMATQLGIRE